MGYNCGYENEDAFVLHFNKKYFGDLDKNSQSLLYDLFTDSIDYNEIFLCWKNREMQKADIFIKHKNLIKSISIKSGSSNSMHSEPIQEFKRYLEKLGVPYKIIDKYISYHYGYKKDDNGQTDFSSILSSYEYKVLYQNEIDHFNNYINNTKIIVDMIDRFIIRGRNSDYDIDALISGTPDDYVWVKKYDIYDLILSNRRADYTSPHIACLTIGPKMRCLLEKKIRSKDRYIVCIRWSFIRESIVNYKNKVSIDKQSTL